MQIDKAEYGSYYGRYVDLVNGIPMKDIWESGYSDVLMVMNNLTDEKAQFRYEPGKWSIKEVFGHMMDTERIFSYRALALARGEETIKGYDHNAYLLNANFDRMSLTSLKEQYCITRKYSKSLFSSFTEEQVRSQGIVNESPFSVRALAYVIVGHELHHLHVIAEKYLPEITSGKP